MAHIFLDESGQFTKHNIQVVKNFEADGCTLMADANKLKQVFLNLFMNAIDAMPEGGTLTIQTSVSLRGGVLLNDDEAIYFKKIASPEKQVRNDTNLIPKTFTLIIQDTGCGIAPKDLPHIFDPFFSKKSNGTGLGLSITQGIVQEHGGGIRVESALGKGTRFVIALPKEEITTS